MSDEDGPLSRHLPREDFDKTFTPLLQEPVRAAMLGSMPSIVAALVGLELLDEVAKRGGTLVLPSAIEEAKSLLALAVTDGVPPHCRGEATEILRWVLDPPAEVEPPLPADTHLRTMQAADVRSRITVAKWAIAEGLDIELEWYDPEEDRWPRRRATPDRVDDESGDEPSLVIETLAGDLSVPIADIRWLMPVARREDAIRTKSARVLTFPGATRREEE